MGLLNNLENQLERYTLTQLQTALQQALDNYRPDCPDCQLALPRHHRYARTITTSYGAVRRQVPEFRCAPCRRPEFQQIIGGMTLLGNDALDQSRPLPTVLKKPDRALTLAAQGLS